MTNAITNTDKSEGN